MAESLPDQEAPVAVPVADTLPLDATVDRRIFHTFADSEDPATATPMYELPPSKSLRYESALATKSQAAPVHAKTRPFWVDC